MSNRHYLISILAILMKMSDNSEVTQLVYEFMKGQRFTFTIEPDLYQPLKAQAKRERRSIGSLLNWLVAQYLEDQQGIDFEPSIQHGGDRRPKSSDKHELMGGEK